MIQYTDEIKQKTLDHFKVLLLSVLPTSGIIVDILNKQSVFRQDFSTVLFFNISQNLNLLNN